MVDAEKQIQENIETIAKIEALPSSTLDIRCTFDVGAQLIGPGGPNGRYIRQCKNASLAGIQGSQLCRVHAKKAMNLDIVKVSANTRLKKGQQVRLSAKGLNLIDPKKIRISIAEYNHYRANNTSCPTSLPPDTGVVDMHTAICSALGQSKTGNP